MPSFVVLFLTKIAKHFIWFFNQLFNLIKVVDEWYSNKKPSTRKDIRWAFICLIIISLYIETRISNNNRITNDKRGNIIRLNAVKKELKECERWKIQRLENEINELETLQRETKEIKRKTKEIAEEI